MKPSVSSLVVLALAVSAAVVCAGPSHGSVTNDCKNYKVKKNLLSVDINWTPYVITPNTQYTINGKIKAMTNISDVLAGGAVWIPERSDPIYKVDEKEATCDDGGVMEALKFLNVTCPIKDGATTSVKDFQYFLPGTEAVLTGTFIIEGYLKEKSSKTLLTCVRTQITIT